MFSSEQVKNMEDPCKECLVEVCCSYINRASCPLRLSYITESLARRGIIMEEEGLRKAIIMDALERSSR